MSSWMSKTKGYPEKLQDWNAEQKKDLWDTMSKIVDEEINPFVRGLVRDYCHTT